MKSRRMLYFVAMIVFAAIATACGASGATSTSTVTNTAASTPTPTSVGELTTSAGVLKITGVELMNRFPPDCSSEANCRVTSGENQILVVWLGRKDDGNIEEVVDKFTQEMLGRNMTKSLPSVTANDGSKATFFGTSLVRLHIGMAFSAAKSASGFTLNWPGQSPIQLGK